MLGDCCPFYSWELETLSLEFSAVRDLILPRRAPLVRTVEASPAFLLDSA